MRIITLLFAGLALSACATGNFATSSTPAQIREEWRRDGLVVWGGTRIYQIGLARLGYNAYAPDRALQVNPGSSELSVWYYGRREARPGLYFYTEAISLGNVTLKPNGRYIVRGEYTEDRAMFWLEDEDTKQVLSKSVQVTIFVRNQPISPPDAGGMPPIVIPILR